MCSLLDFWISPRDARPYVRTPAFHYTDPPPIAVLPDSTLQDIFELEWDGEVFPPERYDWRPDSEKASTRSILRVCKRWYLLCEPILYRNVRLQNVGNGGRATKGLRCLHRTLKQRPDLRSCTRQVYLEVDYSPKEHSLSYHVELISQMLQWWLTSLKKATFHGDTHSPQVGPIFLHLQQLLCLRDLCISGYHFGLSIGFFLKHHQSTRLETLDWSRASWLDDTNLLAPGSDAWPGPAPFVNKSREDIYLPPSRQFSSNLKNLNMKEPYSPPAALEILLKWPTALESLSISSLHSPCSRQYTASAIEKLLEIQSHSLRSVHLGIFQGPSSIPDVSNLSQLRDLRLSYYNVFKTPPATACSKLAAPQLRCLTVSFSTEDQHDQSHDAANREIGDWLVEFARLWKLLNHTCSLKEIKLDFYLRWHDEYFQRTIQSEGIYWPWAHMEDARKKMQPYGICLIWPMSHMNEQTWKAVIAVECEVEAEKSAQREKEEAERNAEDFLTGDEEEEPSDESYPQHHDPSQRRLCRIFGSRPCVH